MYGSISCQANKTNTEGKRKLIIYLFVTLPKCGCHSWSTLLIFRVLIQLIANDFGFIHMVPLIYEYGII